MIPAISNIAWPIQFRDEAYSALREFGVPGLEIAPGLFLPDASDPFDPEPSVAASSLEMVANTGLELVSMQAITFGVEGIALFGTSAEREGFDAALRRAISLAERLSVPAMVFGSPRHRIRPDDITPNQAITIAAEVFSQLAGPAATAGTRFALEANPEAYGTNFMTEIEEVITIVEEVNHPAVGLNLDLGAQVLNGQKNHLEALLDQALNHIVHVHVSEPFLAPFPTDIPLIEKLVTMLSERGYQGAISIEMRPAEVDPIGAVRSALEHLTEVFRKVVRS